MCEILFMAKNKGADEVKGHRKGDPIAVMPNGHAWGAGEDKRAHLAKYGNTDNWQGLFVVVQITDLSVAKAETYLEPHTRDANIAEDEFNAPDPQDRKVQLLRKKWGVFIDELPAGFKSTLATDGYAAVTISQVKTYFRNKVLGTEISG